MPVDRVGMSNRNVDRNSEIEEPWYFRINQDDVDEYNATQKDKAAQQQYTQVNNTNDEGRTRGETSSPKTPEKLVVNNFRSATRGEVADHIKHDVLTAVQNARLLDKSAATLIAGAAGVNMRGVVWVDCNMETEWFDKFDERKLMSIAWDGVIQKDNMLMDEMESRVVGTNPNGPTNSGQQVRLKHITSILQEFRKQQLKMQLHSLSPTSEAAMSGVVLDTIAEFTQLTQLKDPKTITYSDRSSIDDADDRVRRLVRMFRRLPFTRNEFCRVSAHTLRYNLALQDGVALSTRRINQIQTDMLRTRISWFRFLDDNFSAVMKELRNFWDARNNQYVFDWTSHRMKMLDSQQYDALNFISPTEQIIRSNDGDNRRPQKHARAWARDDEKDNLPLHNDMHNAPEKDNQNSDPLDGFTGGSIYMQAKQTGVMMGAANQTGVSHTGVMMGAANQTGVSQTGVMMGAANQTGVDQTGEVMGAANQTGVDQTGEVMGAKQMGGGVFGSIMQRLT